MATYDDHLSLIGKRVVDFLLVLGLNELFSLGVTAVPLYTSDYRFKIGVFAPTGSVDPKFQVEGIALTNHSFSQKTTINYLSYGIKI